jgi:ATP-dependent DNA helicase RecQ
MLDEYRNLQHADAEKQLPYLNSIYELAAKEKGRPRIYDLINFIQEMRTSDIDRLLAKHGELSKENHFTIATIHKVKGLQFDAVIVLPSNAPFPFSGNNNLKVESIDSAEEARLYYVAMTRARNRLYTGWGSRETAWYNGFNFNGVKNDRHTVILQGSPSEMFVSWAGQVNQVQNGLQEYIESKVSVGDELLLNRRNINHNDKTIAMISGNTEQKLAEAGSGQKIRVSEIIRYTCGPYFKEHSLVFWNKLAPNIQRQGWFYIVLVEEYTR